MPFSRGQLEADATLLTVRRGRRRSDVYISQEESLSIRRFPILEGRLGQSDATACNLYIIRTA
jgi:hypothetical protein